MKMKMKINMQMTLICLGRTLTLKDESQFGIYVFGKILQKWVKDSSQVFFFSSY